MTYEQLLEMLRDMHPDIDFETADSIAAELSETYGVELGAVDIVPENFNSARALFALIERIENE